MQVRERIYNWQDQTPTHAAAIEQDGLSVLRAIGAGTLPLPPAVRTLGFEPVDAETGRATFRLDPAEYHLNPFGIVHGGVLAAVLDTAMGCAVHSMLPAAVAYVTSEMNVRFLRPAVVSGGPLVCVGEVVNAGRSAMVASATIVDLQDRVIAVAGATCLVRAPA